MTDHRLLDRWLHKQDKAAMKLLHNDAKRSEVFDPVKLVTFYRWDALGEPSLFAAWDHHHSRPYRES